MDLNDHHAREVCIISQELLQCQCNNVQGVGRWSPPSEVVDLTKIKGQFGGKLKGKLQEDRKAACGGNESIEKDGVVVLGVSMRRR